MGLTPTVTFLPEYHNWATSEVTMSSALRHCYCRRQFAHLGSWISACYAFFWRFVGLILAFGEPVDHLHNYSGCSDLEELYAFAPLMMIDA